MPTHTKCMDREVEPPSWRQRRRLTSGIARTALLALLSACADVEGLIQPDHFHFVDIVSKNEPGPGGWRAACIHAYINNGRTQQYAMCRFGVEMPIESAEVLISHQLAQRVAADVANLTVREVLATATDASPIGILCEQFKVAYDVNLRGAIRGSRVKTACHKLTTPVIFGAPPK